MNKKKEKIKKVRTRRKHSEETKKKIGIGNRGKAVGEKNGNWKGGITPKYHKIKRSIEYRLWRKAVFARDNWTCQKYGGKEIKLIPHHIQNFAEYPELRLVIDNGITLSEKAHKKFHDKYGYRNNTREQTEEFINKTLKNIMYIQKPDQHETPEFVEKGYHNVLADKLISEDGRKFQVEHEEELKSNLADLNIEQRQEREAEENNG